MTTWAIQAVDDADDDGGTLYVLHDECGQAIQEASWPQPLERYAADHGWTTRRTAYVPVTASDCDQPRTPRRRGMTMTDDLMREVHEAVNPFPKACKIEGCDNVATGKASFSGLCDTHKSAEASRRNEMRWAKGQTMSVNPPPTNGSKIQPMSLVELAHLIEGLRVALADAERIHVAAQEALEDALETMRVAISD